jgi:hypothetical protein
MKLDLAGICSRVKYYDHEEMKDEICLIPLMWTTGFFEGRVSIRTGW